RSLNPPPWRSLQPAINAPPAIVALLGDPQTTTDLADLLALAQPHLGLPQHPDRLLGRVVLPCHFVLLSKLKIAGSLTLALAPIAGSRPDPRSPAGRQHRQVPHLPAR